MFEGFSPETFDFLWGIRMNNNREWFTEHKQQYVTTLYEPMKALGKHLYQVIQDRPGHICRVSRIYKDARMHPAEPYKDSLWICIRPEVEWWGENPCLYFEIRPEEVSYGFFLYHPRTATLEDFRRDISARPEQFLELVRSVEEATNTPITAQVYKRPKETENEALKPYFAWRGCIGCTREVAPGQELFVREIGDEVLDFFQKVLPLYDYFCQFQV